MAVTPEGIESWRNPVVFVNTSARKLRLRLGAAAADRSPHESDEHHR